MKLVYTKKIISGILLGVFTLFSIPNSWADNRSAASDPISSVTADTDTNGTTSPSASSNDTSSNSSSSNNTTNASNNNSSDNNNSTASKSSQDAIGNMLLQSVSLMGIAYKWGGNTPDTGMDCSGFVRYVFKKSLGINLPRTAAEMAKVGKRVSLNQLQPGDLIFFNTRRGSNTHIGIYLGGNKFIQSPRTGESIQISDLSGYWAAHFNGAKRVVQEDQDDSGNTSVQSFQNIRDEALPSSSRGRAMRSHSSRHRRAKSAHTVVSHSSSKKTSKKNHKKKSH